MFIHHQQYHDRATTVMENSSSVTIHGRESSQQQPQYDSSININSTITCNSDDQDDTTRRNRIINIITNNKLKKLQQYKCDEYEKGKIQKTRRNYMKSQLLQKKFQLLKWKQYLILSFILFMLIHSSTHSILIVSANEISTQFLNVLTETNSNSTQSTTAVNQCDVNCILPFILVPVGLILVFCVLPICAFGIHKTISEGDWSSNCCFKVLDVLNGKNPYRSTSNASSDQLENENADNVGDRGENSRRYTEASTVEYSSTAMENYEQDSDRNTSNAAQQTEAVVYYYSSVNHV